MWDGQGTGDLDGVFGRLYDASGVAKGGEFLINESAVDSQRFAQVAMDASGNFVVTWSSNNQDGDNWGVFLRRYDHGGVALGGEQLVNSNTIDRQWLSSVAMNRDGRFVVGFRDDGQAGELYFQIYEADGTLRGPEVQIPSANTVSANFPQLAIDDAGRVTAVWEDFFDANDYAILARQFDADGNPLGAQFVVNTHEQWHQDYPSIAMTGDGQLNVVFTDWNRYDDNQYTVEMRRYQSASTEAGGTASFDFVLDTQPGSDVTINLSMPDGTEGTISASSLTFTAANWNVPQTVTVTGVDDALPDGNITHWLVTSATSSVDPVYDALEVLDVRLVNLDDDPALDLDADDSAAAGIDYSATWVDASGPSRWWTSMRR